MVGVLPSLLEYGKLGGQHVEVVEKRLKKGERIAGVF